MGLFSVRLELCVLELLSGQWELPSGDTEGTAEHSQLSAQPHTRGGLEGTLKIILFTPCHLPPPQGAPRLPNFQVWGSHSFSGKPFQCLTTLPVPSPPQQTGATQPALKMAQQDVKSPPSCATTQHADLLCSQEQEVF